MTECKKIVFKLFLDLPEENKWSLECHVCPSLWVTVSSLGVYLLARSPAPLRLEIKLLFMA